MPVPRYLKGECRACGSRALVSAVAADEGATAMDGTPVKPGDRLTVCDYCGAITKVQAKPAKEASARKPTQPKRRRRPAATPASGATRSAGAPSGPQTDTTTQRGGIP